MGKRLIPYPVRIGLRRLNWWRLYWQQNLIDQGKAVYCPIAQREFRAFIRKGTEQITPSNGARSRQRLVWHYLVHQLNLLEQKRRLLHIAPEFSFREILSQQANLTYLAGDKMSRGYANQPGVRPLDLTQLLLPDHSFDLILCNHVLEHIADDRAAMAEMYRVLRPGGLSIITVPLDENLTNTYEDATITHPRQRRRHFGQWDHVRWYGLDIKDRLQEAGFSVRLIRYAQEFTPEQQAYYGFDQSLIIEAKKKPD